MKKVLTSSSVRRIIENNYKAEVSSAVLQGDYIIINCATAEKNFPFIALRLLNYFPQLRMVHFTGGWVEGVYTRETLRYAGYKVKHV